MAAVETGQPIQRRSTFASSDGTDSISKRPSRVISVDKKTTLTCEHIEVASILLPPSAPAPKRKDSSGWKSLTKGFKVKPVALPAPVPIQNDRAKLLNQILSSSAPANPCANASSASSIASSEKSARSKLVNFAPLPPPPDRGRSPAAGYGVSNRGSMIRGQSAPPGFASSSNNLPGYNAQCARGGFTQFGGLSEADMLTWRDLIKGTKKLLAKNSAGSKGAAKQQEEDEEEEDVEDSEDESESDNAPKTPPPASTQTLPLVTPAKSEGPKTLPHAVPIIVARRSSLEHNNPIMPPQVNSGAT